MLNKKIFVFVLLASLFLSLYPAQAQIVHENPDTLPVYKPYDADQKQATALVEMFGSLDNFAAHVSASDFAASRKDIALFAMAHADFTEAYLKAGNTGPEMEAIAEKLDFMSVDLWETLNISEAYSAGLAEYLNNTAAGDTAGAARIASRMQVPYAEMGELLKRFSANTTSILRNLDNSTVDTTRLELGIAAMDSYTARMKESNMGPSSLLGNAGLTLTAGSREAFTGDWIALTAALRLTGATSAGRLIRFFVDDAPAGSETTDVNGVCTLMYRVDGRSFGRTMVAQAEFDPAGESLSPAVSNIVEIKRIPERALLQVHAAPGVASGGDTIYVYGTLTTWYGMPAAGQTVNISMAGIPAGSVTTTADGSYSVTVPVRPDMPAGECYIQSSYEGSPDSALMGALSSPCVVRISPVGSLVTLDPPQAAYKGGEMAAFNGTLTSGDGRPVPGADVSIFAGDALIGTGRTDVGGRYEILAPIPYNITPGDNDVYASFNPGEGRALTGSRSAAFTARFDPVAARAIVRGIPLIAFPGDDLNLTGVLMTDDEQPLDGLQVTISIPGTAEAMTTGAGGSFGIYRKVTGPGIYSLTISAPGDGLLSALDHGAGFMLVMPFDRAGTTLALMVVALTIGIALREKTARRGNQRRKPLPRPTISLVVLKPGEGEAVFSFEEELKTIDRAISAGNDRREAVRSIYLATMRMLLDADPALPRSITHRELCQLLSVRQPSMAMPLEFITASYEIAVFGDYPATDGDIYGSLYNLGELRKLMYGNGGFSS